MLDTLHRIVKEVNAAQKPEAVLSILSERVQIALEADVCAVLLPAEMPDLYIIAACSGIKFPEGQAPLHFPSHQGHIGRVIGRGESLALCTSEGESPFKLAGHPYAAFLGAPMVHHREQVGLLMVLQSEPQPFDASAQAFLMTLATRLAGQILQVQQADAVSAQRKESDRAKRCIILSGIPSAPGIGVGEAFVVFQDSDLGAVPDKKTEDIPGEVRILEDAVQFVRKTVETLGQRFDATIPAEERGLFSAYIRLLESDALAGEMLDVVREGQWAQGAVAQVILKHVAQFEAMDDPYLRERAVDMRDIGRRLLARLQGVDQTAETRTFPKKTILLGDEVTPADLASVPEGQLAGIFSVKGSTNSHVAILARAINVPAVMGIPGVSVGAFDEQKIIIDGYFGQVYISPTDKIYAQFESLVDEETALEENLEQLRDEPARTTDDYGLSLYVNTGLGSDIRRALTAGADGIGLFRTEIPFMMRDRFPSEAEQTIIYKQLIKAFSPRPVMIRTLDIGGDKVLPYFPVVEDNPFLGWRGIRITLDHPEIFSLQLRAMLRASEGFSNLHIMFPMVSSVVEVDEAKRLLNQAFKELIDEGLKLSMPAIGVMIEVPAAVYQSRAIAKRVDFLSVGSNDLIQYVLAVDRNNARVDRLYDNCHPAVLMALQQVVENAHAEGKHVSICGEMAGDPLVVMLLLAMGFDTLSMSAPRLLKIKWVIRQFSIETARELLKEALRLEDPLAVRCRLEMALEKAGVGGLIRAGR